MADQEREQESESELVLKTRFQIMRLKTCWENSSQRRALAEDSIKFIEQDQRAWLYANPAETKEHWDNKIKVAVNFAKQMLENVTTTYVSPPVRSAKPKGEAEKAKAQAPVEEPPPPAPAEDGQAPPPQPPQQPEKDPLQEWLEDHVWNFGQYGGVDPVMQDVDLWTLFLGTTCVEPRYQAEGIHADHDGVELVYYRRPEFEVLPDDKDPRRAQAVVTSVKVRQQKRNVGDANTGSSTRYGTVIRHYWDKDVFCRLVDWEIDKSQGNPEDPRWQDGIFKHGIGRIPLAFIRDSRPQLDFWSYGVHEQLVPLAVNLNKLITEYIHVLKVQHGYFWTNGKLKSKTMAVDSLIEVGEDGTLNLLAPAANLEGMLTGIQTVLDWLSIVFGMAPGSMRMTPSQTASGVAIIAERAETEKIRKKRLPTFQAFEKEFCRNSIDVQNAFSGAEDVAQADITVAFQDPPAQVAEAEKREGLQFELDNGLTTRLKALMELHPNMTEEQAKAQLAEVDAEKKANAPPIPAAGVPGQNGQSTNPIAALIQSKRQPPPQRVQNQPPVE